MESNGKLSISSILNKFNWLHIKSESTILDAISINVNAVKPMYVCVCVYIQVYVH